MLCVPEVYSQSNFFRVLFLKEMGRPIHPNSLHSDVPRRSVLAS